MAGLCWGMCCEQWGSVGFDYISVLLWVEIWDSVTKTVLYTHTHTHTNWHHKSPSYTSVHLSSPGDSKSLHTTAAFTDTKTSACRWNSNTFTITHSHVNTLHSSWGETTYFSPLQHWGDWEREIWQRIFLLTRNPQRRDPEAVRRVSSSHTLSLSPHTTHTQRRIAHMPNP